MSATTLEPAARTLRLTEPPTTGADVAALQTLLAQYHPGPVDGVFGPLTAAAVERAKWTLGYAQPDGVAEPALLRLLGGAPAAPDDAARARSRARVAARTPALRARIAAGARWAIAHEPAIHYAEARPIEGLREPRRLPLGTDCSGFVTLCYVWAGAPDPNGLAYDGEGWTGTLLAHMQLLPADAVAPGDVVVFGPPPGVHCALALEAGPDPLLASHGQERGPLAIRWAAEAAGRPAPATWLTSLPTPQAQAPAPASGGGAP
jgi:cell wall-associated NlpC family hydrolase